MPAKPRYGSVEAKPSDWGFGSSDSAMLRSIYKSSPLYTSRVLVHLQDSNIKGSMDTHANFIEYAKLVMFPRVQTGDLAMFPTGVQMDYQNAPDKASSSITLSGPPDDGKVVDGDGVGASPLVAPGFGSYLPNPTPPGEGNGLDPAKIAALDDGTIKSMIPAGARPNEGGLVNPIVTSAEISSHDLAKIQPFGRHPNDSGIQIPGGPA